MSSSDSVSRRNALLVILLVTVGILYGSLYPFTLDVERPEGGPLLALLRTWSRPPGGRGDLIVNIVLYMPFGFFAALAMRASSHSWRQVLLASLAGLVLSLFVEVSQFYDAGRVIAMSDVYLNTLGTLVGATAALIVGQSMRWGFMAAPAREPIPFLLLLAWFGYRYFPYVPVINLHKYWRAVQPLILTPSLPPFDLFRYAVMWLFLAYLITRVFGAGRRFLALFALLVAMEICGKVFIMDNALAWADLVGAALAFAIWQPLAKARRRAAIVASVFVLLLVMIRLEPFVFSIQPQDFEWVPFKSFLNNSLAVNVQSFFEKCFLYGGAIWILTEAGLRLRFAGVAVAAVLFGTSLVEIYLPGRSAEVTDTVLALILALVFRLVSAPSKSEVPAAQPT